MGSAWGWETPWWAWWDEKRELWALVTSWTTLLQTSCYVKPLLWFECVPQMLGAGTWSPVQLRGEVFKGWLNRLSEMGHTQKDKYCMVFVTCRTQTWKNGMKVEGALFWKRSGTVGVGNERWVWSEYIMKPTILYNYTKLIKVH
jgi:hypothetical protein